MRTETHAHHLLHLLWLAPLLALLYYGIYVEPARIEVTQHRVGGDGTQQTARIVQISDLHMREFDTLRREVARRTQALQPDAIVLSGDIVDRLDGMAALDSFLEALGPTPKFAVLGNWEYWSEIDRKALAEAYARHNGKLLVNDCAVLKIQGRELAFVGLDDALAGKPNLNKAQARCENGSGATGRILIEHTPDFFGTPLATPAASPFMLNLSGHTHGGQIAPFGHPLDLPPGSGAYNWGWYDTRYGKLYVSRGIGVSVVPMRIGSAPELTVFEVGLR